MPLPNTDSSNGGQQLHLSTGQGLGCLEFRCRIFRPDPLTLGPHPGSRPRERCEQSAGWLLWHHRRESIISSREPSRISKEPEGGEKERGRGSSLGSPRRLRPAQSVRIPRSWLHQGPQSVRAARGGVARSLPGGRTGYRATGRSALGRREAGRSGTGRGLWGGARRPISGGAERAPDQRASAQRRQRPRRAPARPPAPRSPPASACLQLSRAPAPPPSAPAAASAPSRCSPGPGPAARLPGPARAPQVAAARAAMGVEGCTKCIKYLLFVFNFVFWVSPGQGERGAGGARRPEPRRPRAPLGPAQGAQRGRQVAGPPVHGGRGVGSPGPAGPAVGGRLGLPRPSTVGRVAASRVSGPLCVRAQSPAAGLAPLGATGLFPIGDGGCGGCGPGAAHPYPGHRSAPLALFLGPPCFARTERGLEGGAHGAPPP